MRKHLLATSLAAIFATGPAAAIDFNFDHYWTFNHTAGNGSAALGAEIVSFDSLNNRLWVIGPTGADVLDPLTKTLATALNLSAFGEPNSVAANNGMIAVAIANSVKTDPGAVHFYNASTFDFVSAVTVGALPDMLTFTPDGSRVLVANEGEPNSYGQPDSIDPNGSVSIIDTASFAVQTLGFEGFSKAAIEVNGGRIFGPGASVAQDLEPEYITVAADGKTAWVVLQENNALARIDLDTPTPAITNVFGLGFKDHSLPGNGLDPSDRDTAGGDPEIDIATFPVFGMYQPDAIASYEVGGKTLLVMANEGDARDYVGFAEEERIKDLDWDPTSAVGSLLADEDLGRLTVTSTLGDPDGDGNYDLAYAFGARSFSIRGENGNLIFDSGDLIEQILADQYPHLWQEGRSDNKGPEPEGLALANIAGRDLLFLGLERTNATMVFDITDPLEVNFLTVLATAGDVGPEGLTVLHMAGQYYLAVANEVSNTTTLYAVTAVPVPAALPLLGSALFGLTVVARRRARAL